MGNTHTTTAKGWRGVAINHGEVRGAYGASLASSSFMLDGIQTVSIRELTDLFIQHNKDEELSPETIKTRRSHLKTFNSYCVALGIHDITQINNLIIEAYFIHYRKTHSKSTTNASKRILKVFIRWVTEYKEISMRVSQENIRLVKEPKKKPQFLERAVIVKAIDGCRKPQHKLIIKVLAEAGLRRAELCDLRVSDLRYDELDIHGKGAKERTIPLTDTLAASLRLYVEETNKLPTDFLFTNKWGTKMQPDTLWRLVKARFESTTGVPVRTHQLRHSFAIHMLQSGANIVTIKELLGHDDINTTMEYLRVTNSVLKSEVKTHMKGYF